MKACARYTTGRRPTRAPSATPGPSGSSRNLNGLSFQWKKQCHNFCGWLPNVVPLLRQIALLNYVLQNILCKRPREEKKLFYSPQQPKVQIILRRPQKIFTNYVDIILTTIYSKNPLLRSFKQDQKRSRQGQKRSRQGQRRSCKAKNDLGKSKNDLARPKKISQGQKRSWQGQRRSCKAINDLGKSKNDLASQKRSRNAKNDLGKAKDDLARPKTISEDQKRSRSTNPLLRSLKYLLAFSENMNFNKQQQKIHIKRALYS